MYYRSYRQDLAVLRIKTRASEMRSRRGLILTESSSFSRLTIMIPQHVYHSLLQACEATLCHKDREMRPCRRGNGSIKTMLLLYCISIAAMMAAFRTRIPGILLSERHVNIPNPAIASSQNLNSDCRYHGNCPVGHLCEDIDGIKLCRPYVGEKEDLTQRSRWPFRQSTRFPACVSECLDELKWDELYFHGQAPNVSATYHALNEHGCVVEYQRIASTLPRENWTISGAEWVKKRHHRVVRVDPLIPESSEKNFTASLWRALCDQPCETQNDCPEGFLCTSHDGKRTSCQRATTWDEENLHDMVVITGADKNYFSVLENFVGSLSYWGPKYRFVVYNLGMSQAQLNVVRTWENLLDLKWADGIPAHYPDHVRIAKVYAWKPIAINESVHEYRSIFWLDAGATFVGSLEPIEFILHRHGLFLGQGQDNPMYYLSHPGTYKAFGRERETFGWRPHYAGGIQGHVFPSRYIDTVVIPNAVCALDRSCIAPQGSSLQNHRFDQTTLSIMAHHENVMAPHYTDYFDFRREVLPSNLTEPSSYIFWNSRGDGKWLLQDPKIPWAKNTSSTQQTARN